ncbi:MAG TPA: DUF362 domain-containing protein [Firmicutes bacterium]|nr:DUF362 domain-containing protein [Bacillota bacterium]
MADVIIKECREYDTEVIKAQINAGMELLGGWGRFVAPGMKVLLKVNLIGPKKPDSAAVTHAGFVRALVQILKNLGCEVWLGDSSGGAIAGIAPTAQSFQVSGLAKVAEEEGAVIKNFDREGAVGVKSESGYVEGMYLAKPMFEADFVINVPKLKTHSATLFTGAVKNLFGCIPGLKKAGYHRLAPDPRDLGTVLYDIHRAVKAGLHIMDGIVAMQGEGPTAGQVYPAGKILISTDPLALDTVAAAMLGMDIAGIPMLLTVKERGLGTADMDKIRIAGDYASPPVLQGFKLPKRYRRTAMGNPAMVVKVIDFLRTRPFINTKLCKNCNMCVESCPVEAIDQETKIINYKVCIECMCCHELCLHKAVGLRQDNRLAAFLMNLYNKVTAARAARG